MIQILQAREDELNRISILLAPGRERQKVVGSGVESSVQLRFPISAVVFVAILFSYTGKVR